MKGTLKKTTAGWFVLYQVSKNSFDSVYDSLPLHPFDVKQIKEDSKVFDNIEARINAYPDVEFEIVMDEPAMMYSLTPYAKLIFPKIKSYENKIRI